MCSPGLWNPCESNPQNTLASAHSISVALCLNIVQRCSLGWCCEFLLARSIHQHQTQEDGVAQRWSSTVARQCRLCSQTLWDHIASWLPINHVRLNEALEFQRPNFFSVYILITAAFSPREVGPCAPSAVRFSQWAFNMSALIAVITCEHRRSYLINQYPKGQLTLGRLVFNKACTLWSLVSWVQPVFLHFLMVLKGPCQEPR